MDKNQLFNRSRLQLAGYYTGVMGVILSLCGVAVYDMTSRDYWRSLDQELTSLAGTLHDGLEPILQQPGRIEPDVQRLLPNLCVVGTGCLALSNIPRVHVLGATQQKGYYVRLLDLSERLLATAGENPQGLPFQQQTTRQHPLQDQQGKHYHQVSLKLKTAQGRAWGYLKVGRSLDEYDAHLQAIRTFLLLGLPIAMLLVGGASWWLAGLAMRPVYQFYQKIQQFTADAAHELRTPVAAIQATVETTLNTNQITLAEAANTLQIIDRQNRRLSHLIQDLLLLSRMDLQVPLTPQPCCLNDLVSDLVEEFAGLAIASKSLLTLDIQVKHPVIVLGNEEQLYRLVANLIANAIHYTPAGGEITVTLEQASRHALVHVQDTGIGIAPDDQLRIFDRFYRVSSDRSRTTGGAGLGLAIAQAIVHRHHGSLQVQSEVNKGSVFTVQLPGISRD